MMHLRMVHVVVDLVLVGGRKRRMLLCSHELVAFKSRLDVEETGRINTVRTIRLGFISRRAREESVRA